MDSKNKKIIKAPQGKATGYCQNPLYSFIRATELRSIEPILAPRPSARWSRPLARRSRLGNVKALLSHFSRSTSLIKFLTIAIVAFLFARLALNLPLVYLPLNLFFVSSYLLLFALLQKNSAWFLFLLAIFLSVDSMFGTYFFAGGRIGQIEYFGTMAVNLLFTTFGIWRDRLKYSS